PPSQKVQVDVRLDEIVLRALEKEPALRYQQVSEVKTQVETIATSRGQGAGAAVQASRRAINWKRTWIWVGISNVLLVVEIFLWFLMGLRLFAPSGLLFQHGGVLGVRSFFFTALAMFFFACFLFFQTQGRPQGAVKSGPPAVEPLSSTEADSSDELRRILTDF